MVLLLSNQYKLWSSGCAVQFQWDRESVLVCPLWLFAELNLEVSAGILVGEMRFLFTCLLHL